MIIVPAKCIQECIPVGRVTLTAVADREGSLLWWGWGYGVSVLAGAGSLFRGRCICDRDRVPTFPDWQNSLTFPWLFQYLFPFFQYSFNVLSFKLKTWSILSNNTQLIWISLKISNNIYLKISHFSSILFHFPWLFQSVQNSLTFPWLENTFPHFSRFSSPSGNPERATPPPPCGQNDRTLWKHYLPLRGW